jgi:4-alpha-glucanotransferase
MENPSALPRRSGVLLHPTSLPSPFGIGDFGPEAYRFVDFLAATGQRLWQMLPLTPPEISNSPYMCLSAFAGNTLLISPHMLLRDGLLESKDLVDIPYFPKDRSDFDSVSSYKTALLDISFALFEKKGDSDLHNQFAKFCRANTHWLDDFSLFMALRETHHLSVWNSWDADIRLRQPSALARWQSQLAGMIRKHKYHQFLFFRQWSALKGYCASKDIKIIGDIPIFIALNSDAVWTHPELFHLDDLGRPTFVSGVPPDYFSETGQLWNNPLYRWDVMAQDGYQWWIERFRAARTFFDIIRIDHFRGFESYWEIPASSKTAIEGRWVAGPGAAFFEKITSVLGELPIIAEDLGVITPAVIQLRDRFNFPGMKVLQFAFNSGSADNPYLPHNYPHNCVVYTGTHDNDTIIGWFRNPQPATTLRPKQLVRERENVLKYLGTNGTDIHWDLIRLAFMSVADTAIIPFQDILGLGSDARMNIPATVSGNWSWRFSEGMITRDIVERLGEMTRLYGR